MIIPYLLRLQSVLVAGGTGSLFYAVPPDQSIELQDFVFVSTGIFNITGFRNGGGTSFTNASAATPILSTLVAAAGNNFNLLKLFTPPLRIEGGDTLYIDLIDTSGAGNTVTFLSMVSKNQK